jgi:hypothetical protein
MWLGNYFATIFHNILNIYKMKKILLILITISLFVSCHTDQGIKIDEIKQDCVANVLSKEDLTNLLYSKDLKGVQFIDIRTPHQYAVSHIPNAINIPQKNFFDKERFEQINKDDMLILYGEDASSPKLMALMAGHFKKGNFYIASGGYEYINNNILRGVGFNTGLYNDEKALVDYQKEIDAIKNRSGAATGKPTKKKKTKAKPLVKRKKKAVSGGCG